MDTPPAGTEVSDLPDSWKPTPKPGPRPSAPAASPRLDTAEANDKADAAEKALRRPGWDITSPGYAPADHEYVNRKSVQFSKKYAAWGAAAAIGFQFFTQLVPMVADLYEKHLDRQAQRMKLEAKP